MPRPQHEALTIMSILPSLTYEEAANYDGDDPDVLIALTLPVPVARARVLPDGDGLRVRALPNLNASELGRWNAHQDVACWGQVTDWALVQDGALAGWSASQYLEVIW